MSASSANSTALNDGHHPAGERETVRARALRPHREAVTVPVHDTDAVAPPREEHVQVSKGPRSPPCHCPPLSTTARLRLSWRITIQRGRSDADLSTALELCSGG